ncbi:MAG: hypothetical protein ACM3XN_07665 [Chloroflexota bacterium]
MGSRQLMILSEQLLRYRELLALSYAQKDAIQKGDLARVASLLDARQELIDKARLSEPPPDDDAGEEPADEDRATERRLMAEAAMLLEKLVSLDKENERLLEVKMATAGGGYGAKPTDGRTGYARAGARRQGASGVLDASK